MSIIKNLLVFLGNAIFFSNKENIKIPTKIIKTDNNSLHLTYDNGEEFVIVVKQTKFLRDVAGVKMYVNEYGDILKLI